MELPLVLSGLSHGGEMALCVVLGFFFGFVLERSGFGRANVLVAIFYGRDFRVMRVMYPAIVVAMIGLYFLDLAGVMPLSNIGLLPSFIAPAAVGGILLGLGFVVGGYCPGTSLVAAASAKLDGMLFILGLFIGMVALQISYDSIAGWHVSTAMGRVLVHEYFGVPSGVAVFVMIAIAVGSMVVVRRIENRVLSGLRKGAA